MSTRTSSKSILISGASIAGPTLAYWLDRYGFNVTVVERTSDVRSGGYPIDVRGTAIDVVERMGLLPQVVGAQPAPGRQGRSHGGGSRRIRGRRGRPHGRGSAIPQGLARGVKWPCFAAILNASAGSYLWIIKS